MRARRTHDDPLSKAWPGPVGGSCAMDWFDREIVGYVVRWANGAMWDEDVYPMFGMNVDQLIRRFHQIISRSVLNLDQLGPTDRKLIGEASCLHEPTDGCDATNSPPHHHLVDVDVDVDAAGGDDRIC